MLPEGKATQRGVREPARTSFLCLPRCLPATGAQESRRPKPLKNWSGQKDSNPRDIDITGAGGGI